MSREEQPLKSIQVKELVAEAEKFRDQGYRMVQICCTLLPDGRFELTDAFDKDYKYAGLRITVAAETEVESVTSVYAGAYLYENEIRELFGTKFKGISVDYNGHLYKKKVDTPFGAKQVREDNTCLKG